MGDLGVKSHAGEEAEYQVSLFPNQLRSEKSSRKQR